MNKQINLSPQMQLHVLPEALQGLCQNWLDNSPWMASLVSDSSQNIAWDWLRQALTATTTAQTLTYLMQALPEKTPEIQGLIYQCIGTIFYRSQAWLQAEQWFRRARMALPKDHRPVYNLILVWIARGAYQDALEALNTISSSLSPYAYAMLKASWAAAQGFWEQTQKEFKEALKANPLALPPLLALGEALFRSGRSLEYQMHLRFLLRQSPEGQTWFSKLPRDAQAQIQQRDLCTHGELLQYLWSQPDIDDAHFNQQVTLWEEIHLPPLRSRKALQQAPTQIQVAYLVPNFTSLYLPDILPLLLGVNQTQFKVHLVTQVSPEAIPLQLRCAHLQMHHPGSLDNWAAYLDQQPFDILVNLMGLHCPELYTLRRLSHPAWHIEGPNLPVATGLLDGYFICRHAQYQPASGRALALSHGSPWNLNEEMRKVNPQPPSSKRVFGCYIAPAYIGAAQCDFWKNLLRHFPEIHLSIGHPDLQDSELVLQLKKKAGDWGLPESRLDIQGFERHSDREIVFFRQLYVLLPALVSPESRAVFQALWQGVPVGFFRPPGWPARLYGDETVEGMNLEIMAFDTFAGLCDWIADLKGPLHTEQVWTRRISVLNSSGIRQQDWLLEIENHYMQLMKQQKESPHGR